MPCFRLILFFLFFLPHAAAAAPVEVTIRGIGGDVLENARKSLVLPHGLVQEGRVNPFWLERFEQDIPGKVKQALEPYGYYQPDVRTKVSKTEGGYRIQVTIQPGRPVRIIGLNLQIRGPGKEEQPLLKLIRDFPLRTGDVLVQPLYEQAKAALRSRAVEMGYLDADFPAHQIAIDPDQASARIDLVMDTGPQYRFGKVFFEGAPRYPLKFLERFLAFKPGDVFSFARMGETQANLVNSERFRSVLPVPQQAEAEQNRVPVLFKLEEAPTRRLRPGIGYATDIGPRLSLDYRDLNVYDRGHEFRSELNLSPRLQSLGAGYVLPAAGNINAMTGFQTNLKHEDVNTYTVRNISAELNRTASLGSGRLGTLYTRLEREKSTVALEPLDSRLVLPGVRLSEQRYDSLVRPRRGHHYTIDIRGTHEAIGSNNRFFQLVLDGSVLIPLPWRLFLFSRAKAGVTFQNAPAGTLPVTYRFFAGGDRSIRGYGYQSLGPADASGRVVGGRDTLVGSLELDRAIFEKWGAAVFYDAGSAFNTFSDFPVFQAAGIGLRYYTIVGALRLDLARQLAVQNPDYRVHLTVGFAF